MKFDSELINLHSYRSCQHAKHLDHKKVSAGVTSWLLPWEGRTLVNRSWAHFEVQWFCQLHPSSPFPDAPPSGVRLSQFPANQILRALLIVRLYEVSTSNLSIFAVPMLSIIQSSNPSIFPVVSTYQDLNLSPNSKTKSMHYQREIFPLDS